MPVTGDDSSPRSTRSTDGVLTLALDRPQRRNALDLRTVDALRAAIADTDAAAVVLASTTPGIFCAGADLSIPDAERAEVSRRLYALYGEMLAAPIPIVAALDGAAVGGGAQLAIAADLRVAGPDAWLRFVGPGHGLAVGAWALPSLVGRGRAIDLCLSGRPVAAAEALSIGLVDRIEEEPAVAAQRLAGEWAGLDRDAVIRVKAIVGRSCERAAALALEADGNLSWSGGGP
jgi:enoyl-CoA hydratase